MVYSLDEIFEKKLWFLLPFYLFVHEKKLDGYEENEEARNELLSEYERIAGCLNELVEKGEMTSYTKKVITDMLVKVALNLAAKRTKTKEGIKKIMFGHVLDHEAKHILNEGISQGREQTITNLIENWLKKGYSVERIAELLDMDVEIVKREQEKRDQIMKE